MSVIINIAFIAALLLQCVTSFTSVNQSVKRDSSLFLIVPPPQPSITLLPKQVIIDITNTPRSTTFGVPEYTSNLQQNALLLNKNNVETSTTASLNLPSMSVSLKDRYTPTKEEVDQKKLTFNLWFWGGGVIAPTVATVFYFGFRFWER